MRSPTLREVCPSDVSLLCGPRILFRLQATRLPTPARVPPARGMILLLMVVAPVDVPEVVMAIMMVRVMAVHNDRLLLDRFCFCGRREGNGERDPGNE